MHNNWLKLHNYNYDSQFFLFINSNCIIWFRLRSLLYLFNTINRHYLCINGYDNNIWIVYFSAVLDHCSMPPNIVQEIVNDCNSRTIHFPIDHKNLNFHIVFSLSLSETFADNGVHLLHIYTHTHTPVHKHTHLKCWHILLLSITLSIRGCKKQKRLKYW